MKNFIGSKEHKELTKRILTDLCLRKEVKNIKGIVELEKRYWLYKKNDLFLLKVMDSYSFDLFFYVGKDIKDCLNNLKLKINCYDTNYKEKTKKYECFEEINFFKNKEDIIVIIKNGYFLNEYIETEYNFVDDEEFEYNKNRLHIKNYSKQKYIEKNKKYLEFKED